MKKKKLLALGMVAALSTTAVIGGTLAYFTDTDSQKNVMTTGKVDISQNEQQRDEQGVLEDFEQDKPLMPRVDTETITRDNIIGTDGYFNESMKNVVDKIVTVKNEAAAGAKNQDAYVRTILAFETATEYEAGTTNVLRDADTIFETYIGYLGDFEKLDRTIKIGDEEFVLAVKVYDDPLEPQGVTEPSLKQIFLSPNANNEVATLFDDEYTILALSQGTQVAGFEDTGAEGALNTAFGYLTEDAANGITESSEEYVTDDELIAWLSACVKE